MSARLQPAIWGGLFIGILSALPFVSALNACCCLWVIAGGVLTTYLMQERSLGPITAGDGAIGGLVAGLIGAVISSVVGIVFAFAFGIGSPDTFQELAGRGDLPPEFAQMFERMANLPMAAWVGIFLVFNLVVYPIFAMLGGLLGVPMFKKNVPPAPPGTIDVTPVQ